MVEVRTPLTAGPDELLGRDAERDVLRRLLRPGPTTPHVAVVFGEAGTGRTALLRDTAAAAVDQGIRVMPVPGLSAETRLTFAALHRLLRPLHDQVRDLAGSPGDALQAALGLSDAAVGAPWGQVALATLTLLRDAAARSGLVVLVDDVQWLDPASREVLSFVAHRVSDVPLTILAARRGAVAPVDLPEDTVHVVLTGLLPPESAAVLDRTHLHREPLRRRILALADGNPLALRELACAVPPDLGPRSDIPLGPRLVQAFGGALDALPEPTRQALLLAATAAGVLDGPVPLPLVDAARPETRDPEVWAPAEQAGVVRVGPAGVEFTHPLTRAAVAAGATWGRRRACHLALADVHRDDPERRVAHLLAAVPHRDADVAGEADRVASRAVARGDHAGAVRAWEAAAARSPDPVAQRRRLVEGLAAAVRGDLYAEGLDLAEHLETVTDDPVDLAAADLARGAAAAGSGRPAEAIPWLVDVARRTADTAPAIAARALVVASSARLHTLPDDRGAEAVEGLLSGLGGAVLEGARLWCHAVGDPLGRRAEVLTGLHRARMAARAGSRLDPDAAAVLGATAVVIDAPDLAVGFLEPLLEPDVTVPHHARQAAQYGWACLDAGRGPGARHAAAVAEASTAGRAHDLVWASATAMRAAVAVRADEIDAGRELAGAVLRALQTSDSTALAVRARHILGVAALVEGDHDGALRALAALFTRDGAPRHPVSWSGLADLALAASRAERVDRADRADTALAAVEYARRTWPATVSPRLRLVLLRARALLDDDDAEEHLRVALAGSAVERWPVEYALARLDLGRWLRRRRRITEARVELAAATEGFELAGARVWAAQAEGELRAAGQPRRAGAGAGAGAAPARATGRRDDDVLAALSAQQQQIVRLAAYGLTNREIGERLFLSPRTVGSHLYRVFPELGISARSQLRDLIEPG